MKRILLALILVIIGCHSESLETNRKNTIDDCNDKIQILNFGTFHFIGSSDASTSFIDVNDSTVQTEIKDLNKKLAEFKPTVILVEATPKANDHLQTLYWEYCNSDVEMTKYGGETGIVGFEVGRLSNTKRIYGIDDYEFRDYDYRIGERNQEYIKDPTFSQIEMESSEWDKIKTLPLIDRLLKINSKEYRDYIINRNMDALHYVNSDGTFDATDQALRLYHRNVRWFANLNKIKLKKDDRVFIIGGSAHTSFIYDMIDRSPKFCIVEASNYLR